MAHYAIGDIQGCFDEFQLLLNRIEFNPGVDTLWITGDIVNRGPKSLETLQFIKQHDGCMQTVLGNHDLHLLAIVYGGAKIKKGDTLEAILKSPHLINLLSWLRQQPLIRENQDFLMVHAGLWPSWSIAEALSFSDEISSILQSKSFYTLLENMYGNKPDYYQKNLQGMDRNRLFLNVMTRMRVLNNKGKLDFHYKGSLQEMPDDLHPWFQDKARITLHKKIIFGHWSSLDLYIQDDVIGLDTGAVWGHLLTAINLKTQEVIQVPSVMKKLFWS